jgi:hypothetical protein
MPQSVDKPPFAVGEIPPREHVKSRQKCPADAPAKTVIYTFLSLLDVYAARQTHGSLLSIPLTANSWKVPRKHPNSEQNSAKQFVSRLRRLRITLLRLSKRCVSRLPHPNGACPDYPIRITLLRLSKRCVSRLPNGACPDYQITQITPRLLPQITLQITFQITPRLQISNSYQRNAECERKCS